MSKESINDRTKELKLKIKEAKSDWKYYLNNGWLPTDKKWD